MDIVNLLLGCIGAASGLLWLHEKAKRLLLARAFWKIFDINTSERVIVVVPTGGKCGDRESPDSTVAPGPNVVTTIEDSMARAAVYRVLAKHGLNPETRLHSMVSEEDLAQHLVLICGPAGNCVTRNLLARGDVAHPYSFARANGRWLIQDREQRVVHSFTDGVTVDHAIVAKYVNPWSDPSKRRRIYLIAGLEGLGTWGAAELLSTRTDSLARVLRTVGGKDSNRQFSVVVSVHRSGTENPRIGDLRVYLS